MREKHARIPTVAPGDRPTRATDLADSVGSAGCGHRAGSPDRPVSDDSTAAPWRLRVTEHSLVAPSDLINHPENYRGHPDAQRRAVTAVIHELGFVGEILVSRRSGRILDGHLRVAEALRDGQEVIPVGWVDCASDEEEAAILATHDPLGAMATADRDKLATLAASVQVSSDALRAVLTTLATRPLTRRPVDPAEQQDDGPNGRVIGAAFGPQGGGRGGRLGKVGGLVYPVVVECPDEQDAEILMEQLADEGHRAYLLPPSPSSMESPS